jgi:hypothetical protein
MVEIMISDEAFLLRLRYLRRLILFFEAYNIIDISQLAT